MTVLQRIALGIEYDGSSYCGWQRQQQSPSIQATLESAIAKVANHDVTVFCAGRTDAGVHAFGQVIHFDSSALRQNSAWVRGVNTYLAKDIRVVWCQFVPQDFDARKCALSRRYCYVISNRKVSPSILQNGITWIYNDLCEKAMQVGAFHLLGTHDFSSYRSAECQAKTSTRTIYDINVSRKNDLLILDVKANAFLHHMVRKIAGSLIAVGQKKYSPTRVKEILEAKDSRLAGPMAAANGLYLIEVSYPSSFLIPCAPSQPWFLNA